MNADKNKPVLLIRVYLRSSAAEFFSSEPGTSGSGRHCPTGCLTSETRVRRTAGTGSAVSERFPFCTVDPALTKDACQQTAANIFRVRIRNSQFSAASLHVTGDRRRTQGAQNPKARRYPINSRRLIGPTAGIQATSRISMRLPSMSGIGGSAMLNSTYPSSTLSNSSRQASRVLVFAQTPGMAGMCP